MQESLIGLASRYLPTLKKNGGECRSPCPFHADTAESLRVGETWRCLMAGCHEESGNDAIGFLAAWEGISREEAAKLIESGNLPPPHPIDTTLRKAPFCSIPQLTKRPDARVWIHDNYDAMRAARDLVPDRIHLGLIPGRSWADLGMLKNRHVVLVPTNTRTAVDRMARLADCLYDAGHGAVRWIEPAAWDGTELPEHWTLVDAKASGATTEQVMAWAGDRVRTYAKNDAAQQDGQGTRADLLAIGAGMSGTHVSGSADGPAAAASPNVAPPELPTSRANPPALSSGHSLGAEAQQPVGAAPHAEVAAPALEMQPRPTPQAARPNLAVVEPTGALRKPDPEPEPELPAFSEFALARRFADGEGEDWRYTAAWGLWCHWNGQRWVPDECKSITWKVKECCSAVMQEHLTDSTPSQRMKIGTLKTVNAVIGLAGSDPGIAAPAAVWDADPMLLGTPSGVVDLRSGAVLEGSREQMISKATGTAPATGAHPWWDKVLARAHRGDASLLAFIQRWCGYLLTGDTREERFLFIHGPGAGGKSKFLMVLSEIMGDYRKTAKMESFTARDKSEHSEEIARLAGARMVTATETEEGSRWNEARIKTLTGRDVIAARHMHKSTFEFAPQFKLIFIGNHRPALRTVGEEMRRRIDLIEWGGTIPEADRVLDLSDKLRAEYPAILAWMIAGCLKWQSEGLGKPAQIEASTQEYLTSEDTLGAWLDECTEMQTNARALAGEVYRSFKRWAEAVGEFVGSQKRLTQRLKDRGFGTVKSGQRYFVGFSLKASDNYEPWHKDD